MPDQRLDDELFEIEQDEDGDVWLRPVVNFEGRYPAKPLSKRQRDKLGDEYEAAELARAEMWAGDGGSYSFSPDNVPFDEFERIMKRHHDAELAYIVAVNAHSLYVRAKAWHSRRVLSQREAFKLKDKMYDASIHAEEIEELSCALGCIKGRELTDAKAARTLAKQLFLIHQEKFRNAEREARADKRAGINRS